MEQGSVMSFYGEFQQHRHLDADLKFLLPERAAHVTAMQRKADEIVAKLINDGLTIAEGQLVLRIAGLFLLDTHAVLPASEDEGQTT